MPKIFLIISFLLLQYNGSAQQLTLADADSKVSFVIKNMGINVDGTFGGLKGKMSFEAKNPAAGFFDVTVDVNTINTSNNKRDNHLRTADFFDVAKYPTIRIVTTQVVAKGGNNYKAIANLTIKNVIKKIGFDFTATPIPSGYRFKSSFVINRRDFGVGGSSMIMSDNVTVNLDVTGKK